jgi:soluble lytic murein transglycosylase-like protein
MTIPELLISAAQAEGVDPRLALEVAIQESGLKQNKVSPKGAIGVMQLMPATAALLGVDPRNLAENIQGGVRYLKQQLSRFGDTAEALAAYNWGPGNVADALAQWGSAWLDHAPAETENYVKAILGRVSSLYQTTVSPAAVASEVAAAAQSLDSETWQRIAVAAVLGIAAYKLFDLILEGE